MEWLISKNHRIVKIEDIPIFEIETLRTQIINEFQNDFIRVVSFFGFKIQDGVKLIVVLADDSNSLLKIASGIINSNQKRYQSITQELFQFHLFERELYENFGIEPIGHPWLKPVRYSNDRYNPDNVIPNYPFFKMEGDEIHEVAVGPIHAGVIEPGHFRFMCHGEKIYHLEIQLGYQHRGIERILLDKINNTNNNYCLHLCESIAGDTVIGHSLAYVEAIEALSSIQIPAKAIIIRSIALELERVATHIGDLSAISNDIAFLIGNAVYGATRTISRNSFMRMCGNRFGRNLIKIGGVKCELNSEETLVLKNALLKTKNDITNMSDAFFSAPSVLSRLEKTGTVTLEQAKKIGMVGLAARASGYPVDLRTDHPWGTYRFFPVFKNSLGSGDVFARTYLRYIEIIQSINYILEQLENLSDDKTINNSITKLPKGAFITSMIEGWRGEIVHNIITDEDGRVIKYKIKDPSFNNWFALGLSVRNNEISDFPLCNKSFNLSYCGYDL